MEFIYNGSEVVFLFVSKLTDPLVQLLVCGGPRILLRFKMGPNIRKCLYANDRKQAEQCYAPGNCAR